MNAEAFILIDGGEVVTADNADAPVPWWSFGKTIIAAVALRLAEQGVLALDEDGPPSLRRLLRHEAGLADYGALPAYHAAVAANETPWPRQGLRERLAGVAAPVDWTYSNLGYLEVRERIETAAGASLGAVAGRLLFEPLGVEAHLAETRADLIGATMGADADYHPGWVYHGLFIGSSEAAARLLAGLLGPSSPLAGSSLAAMRQTRSLPQFAGAVWRSPGYGLGLMRSSTETGFIAEGHTGGGPGSDIAVYARADRPGRVAAVFSTKPAGSLVEAEAVRLLA